MKKTSVASITSNVLFVLILSTVLVEKEQDTKDSTEHSVSQPVALLQSQNQTLSHFSFASPKILENWSVEAPSAVEKISDEKVSVGDIAEVRAGDFAQPLLPLTKKPGDRGTAKLIPASYESDVQKPEKLVPLSALNPALAKTAKPAQLAAVKETGSTRQTALSSITPLTYKKPKPNTERLFEVKIKTELKDKMTIKGQDTLVRNIATDTSEKRNKPALLPPPSMTEVKATQLILNNLDRVEGLAMTFIWPEDTYVKSRIHRALKECYGMRLGHLKQNGQLYFSNTQKATKAELNFYSPLLRLVSVPIDKREIEEIRKIKTDVSGQLVRLFPKRLDAYILANLKQVLNPAEKLKGQFTGVYQFKGGKPGLGNLKLNGQLLNVEIELPVSQIGCL